LRQTLLQTAPHDLVHLEGPHALLGHPLQGRRLRPVAAQSQLEKPVATARPGFDEPPHRQTVPDEAAELEVAGVGVRVEMDDAHPSPTFGPGYARDVRPGHCMVAAEDHRKRVCFRHPLHDVFQSVQRLARLHPRHLDVARVKDAQVLQRVDPQSQVRAGGVVRQVVGRPDRLRSEAGAGAVGGAGIVRRTDDDHVCALEAGGILRLTAIDTEECDVRSVHTPHARHSGSLPAAPGIVQSQPDEAAARGVRSRHGWTYRLRCATCTPPCGCITLVSGKMEPVPMMRELCTCRPRPRRSALGLLLDLPWYRRRKSSPARWSACSLARFAAVGRVSPADTAHCGALLYRVDYRSETNTGFDLP